MSQASPMACCIEWRNEDHQGGAIGVNNLIADAQQ